MSLGTTIAAIKNLAVWINSNAGHIFNTTTERDTFFSTHADQIKENMFIFTGNTLQRRENGAWVDRSLGIRGPQSSNPNFVLGPADNQFTSTVSRADALSKVTTYATANASWLTEYNNHGLDHSGVVTYAITIIYPLSGNNVGETLARSGSNWVSIGTAVVGLQGLRGPQGPAGSAANLAAVRPGNIPIKGQDNINFVDSGISRLNAGTGEYEFQMGVIVPRNSMQVGYGGVLSGFGSVIKFKSLYTGKVGVFPFQYYEPETGSTRIKEISFGPQVRIERQPTDTVDTPLSGMFTIPASAFSVLWSVILKTTANTTATGLRFSAKVQNQTDPFFYYPGKYQVENSTGETVVSDANGLVVLDLTPAPVVVPDGDIIEITYAIDSLSTGTTAIKGDGTIPYIAFDRSVITLKDIARAEDLGPANYPFTRLSADTTVSATNVATIKQHTVVFSNTTGTKTLNLGGTSIWTDGDEFVVKHAATGGSGVTITPGGTATIDGDTSLTIAPGTAVWFKTDVTNDKFLRLSSWSTQTAAPTLTINSTAPNNRISYNYNGTAGTVDITPNIDATLTGVGSSASALGVDVTSPKLKSAIRNVANDSTPTISLEQITDVNVSTVGSASSSLLTAFQATTSASTWDIEKTTGEIWANLILPIGSASIATITNNIASGSKFSIDFTQSSGSQKVTFVVASVSTSSDATNTTILINGQIDGTISTGVASMVSATGGASIDTWNARITGNGCYTAIYPSNDFKNSLLVRNSTNTAWTTLAPGAAGQVVTMVGGVPTYQDLPTPANPTVRHFINSSSTLTVANVVANLSTATTLTTWDSDGANSFTTTQTAGTRSLYVIVPYPLRATQYSATPPSPGVAVSATMVRVGNFVENGHVYSVFRGTPGVAFTAASWTMAYTLSSTVGLISYSGSVPVDGELLIGTGDQYTTKKSNITLVSGKIPSTSVAISSASFSNQVNLNDPTNWTSYRFKRLNFTGTGPNVRGVYTLPNLQSGYSWLNIGDWVEVISTLTGNANCQIATANSGQYLAGQLSGSSVNINSNVVYRITYTGNSNNWDVSIGVGGASGGDFVSITNTVPVQYWAADVVGESVYHVGNTEIRSGNTIVYHNTSMHAMSSDISISQFRIIFDNKVAACAFFKSLSGSASFPSVIADIPNGTLTTTDAFNYLDNTILQSSYDAGRTVLPTPFQVKQLQYLSTDTMRATLENIDTNNLYIGGTVTISAATNTLNNGTFVITNFNTVGTTTTVDYSLVGCDATYDVGDGTYTVAALSPVFYWRMSNPSSTSGAWGGTVQLALTPDFATLAEADPAWYANTGISWTTTVIFPMLLDAIGGDLTVQGALHANTTATIGGNTSVGGTLNVTGASNIHALSVAGNETVSGTLSVTGISTLTGNTTVGGSLGITGASTMSSLSVTGNETVGGTLNVTGATTLSSASVTGNETVGGTLSVTGISTLTGNTTVGGTLGVTNNTTMGADLTVAGTIYSGGTKVYPGESVLATTAPYYSKSSLTFGTSTTKPVTIRALGRDVVTLDDYQNSIPASVTGLPLINTSVVSGGISSTGRVVLSTMYNTQAYTYANSGASGIYGSDFTLLSNDIGFPRGAWTSGAVCFYTYDTGLGTVVRVFNSSTGANYTSQTLNVTAITVWASSPSNNRIAFYSNGDYTIHTTNWTTAGSSIAYGPTRNQSTSTFQVADKAMLVADDTTIYGINNTGDLFTVNTSNVGSILVTQFVAGGSGNYRIGFNNSTNTIVGCGPDGAISTYNLTTSIVTRYRGHSQVSTVYCIGISDSDVIHVYGLNSGATAVYHATISDAQMTATFADNVVVTDRITAANGVYTNNVTVGGSVTSTGDITTSGLLYANGSRVYEGDMVRVAAYAYPQQSEVVIGTSTSKPVSLKAYDTTLVTLDDIATETGAACSGLLAPSTFTGGGLTDDGYFALGFQNSSASELRYSTGTSFTSIGTLLGTSRGSITGGNYAVYLTESYPWTTLTRVGISAGTTDYSWTGIYWTGAAAWALSPDTNRILLVTPDGDYRLYSASWSFSASSFSLMSTRSRSTAQYRVADQAVAVLNDGTIYGVNTSGDLFRITTGDVSSILVSNFVNAGTGNWRIGLRGASNILAAVSPTGSVATYNISTGVVTRFKATSIVNTVYAIGVSSTGSPVIIGYNGTTYHKVTLDSSLTAQFPRNVQVEGALKSIGTLVDSTGSAGTTGQAPLSTGSGWAWGAVQNIPYSVSSPQIGEALVWDGTNWTNSRKSGSAMARRQSSAQAIGNLTDVRVVFDTPDSAQAMNTGDVGLTYDSTTNIGRFTNTSGRRVMLSVSFQVLWDSDQHGQRFVWIRKAGDAGNRLAYVGIGPSPNDVTVCNGSCIVGLDDQQFFEVWCYQSSGTAINIGNAVGGASTGYANRISIARLND